MGELKSTEIIQYIDNPEPIIIEIGAYRGDDTCNFVKFINGKIIAVEPDPRNIPHLKELQKNNKNLTIYENAIFDKNDEIMEFYLSELDVNSDQATFSNSLLKPKLHIQKHPRILFKHKCMVKTITLDTIYENNKLNIIDFIWADVQGAEKFLINGGINTLKHTKYFYTEYCVSELYENSTKLQTIIEMLPFMSIVDLPKSNKCDNEKDAEDILFKNNLL